MSRFAATCGSDETLSQAAQKMQNSNGALLPVTAGEGSQSLIGTITDGARPGSGWPSLGTGRGRIRVDWLEQFLQ